jgi:hypothetical protein
MLLLTQMDLEILHADGMSISVALAKCCTVSRNEDCWYGTFVGKTVIL